MARWLRKLLVGLSLMAIFLVADGLQVPLATKQHSLSQHVHAFEPTKVGPSSRPNRLQVVVYDRANKELRACYVSGRCHYYCDVPSYEFDSFRWSVLPDSYFYVRIGALSAGYQCGGRPSSRS